MRIQPSVTIRTIRAFSVLVLFTQCELQAFRIRRGRARKSTRIANTSNLSTNSTFRADIASTRFAGTSNSSTNSTFRADIAATATGTFLIGVHEKMLRDGWDILKMDDSRETQQLLRGLVGVFRSHGRFQGTGIQEFLTWLVQGVKWPDCPLKGDVGYAGSCIGPAPAHHGFVEMGLQMVHKKAFFMAFANKSLGFSPAVGLVDFRCHEMSPFRLAIQHHHASPWLPVHREPKVDGSGRIQDHPHLATVSNRQVRSKAVQQSLEWACKGFHLYRMWLRTDDPQDVDNFMYFQAGMTYLGKLFHVLQDSFSQSHTVREPCAGPIQKLLSMDDVDWSKHGKADGLNGSYFNRPEECEAASSERSAELIKTYLPFLTDPASNPDEHLQHIASHLCTRVFEFAQHPRDVIDAGAGGTTPYVSQNVGLGTTAKELREKNKMDNLSTDILEGEGNWRAEFAETRPAKEEVQRKFLSDLVKAETERKNGKGFMDKNIPYWYPFGNGGGQQCPPEMNFMPWETPADGEPPARCKNFDMCNPPEEITCSKLLGNPADIYAFLEELKQEGTIMAGGMTALRKIGVAAPHLKKAVEGLQDIASGTKSAVIEKLRPDPPVEPLMAT